MSNNNDLDLGLNFFDLDEFMAQGARADEVLDGVGTSAEKMAARVEAATQAMGTSWQVERTKEEDAAEAAQRKLNSIIDQAIREEQRRTAAVERELEKQAAAYKKLLDDRERDEAKWRRVQAAHASALKENAARDAEGDFFKSEGANQLKHGLRTASILSGIRDSRSIDAFLGGFGGPMGIIGIGTALAGGAAFNLVKNAAQQAQDLKKLSDAMGISVTQAGKLSLAANLAGENMDTMSSASAKLAEALENPGTIGKKTAEALIDLGVSMRQGVGAAFQEAAEKLIAIKDPTRQAALGMQIFGQQWKAVLETIKEVPNVGQTIDAGLNQKLVEANHNLKEFGNTWTIWKGEAAGAIISVTSELDKMAAYTKIAGGLFGVLTGTAKPQKPFQPATGPQMLPGDPTRLNALLKDSSKESLQEQLAKAKAAQANIEMQARGDAGRKAPQQLLNADASGVTKARKEVERLEAAIKAADKAAANAQNLPELLAQWHDRAAGLGQPNAIAHLDDEYKKEVRKYGLKPFSSSWSDLTASYGLLRSDAAKKAADEQSKKLLEISELKDRMDAAMSGTSNKSQFDILSATNDPASAWFNFVAPKPTLQAPGMLSARNQGQINRAFARGTTELNQAFNPSMDQTEVGRENLQLKLQEIEATRQLALEEAKVLEPAKQQAEIEKANTEATIQRYQSIVEYETQIAEIRKSQLNETRSFGVGMFNAALSGRPGAGGDFLRSWSTGIADKIVGNFAANTLGTFNSHLTLQHDQGKSGLLSDGNGHLTAIGKLLQGTPFGLDPAGAKLDPAKLATQSNTAALTGLTSEIQALIQVIGQASGIDTSSVAAATKGVTSTPKPSPSTKGGAVLPILGAGAGVVRGVQTGDISGLTSSFQRIARLVGSPGATPTFLPAGITAGGNSLVGGDDSLPYDGPSINWQIPGLAGSLDTGGFGGYTPPAGSYNPETAMALDPGGMQNILKSLGTINSTPGINSVTGAASTLSKLGGLSKGASDALSGNTLGTIFGSTAGTAEKFGAGLSAGATSTAGILAAIKGFGGGGARGVIQGIAGAGAAIAPFAGPAAPLVEAGSAIAGLIGSLFPDPRQKRIKREQQTVLGQAYIQPASQDYNFTAGDPSEGYSFGMGGAIRAGGQTSNTTIQIQAMDAASFADWGAKNPQAMAQAMLYGVTNGSNAALMAELQYRASQTGFFG